MANNKKGFIYYSVDTNRYQDIKIKKLKKDFGCSGICIYDYILCEIYRVEGCFIKWDGSTVFDVAEYFGLKEALISEIVNYCCHVGLFNKRLLDSESVLTSMSIQHRFTEWSMKAKRKDAKIPEKYLILTEEPFKLPEESTKLPEVSDKVKESKGKKSKVKESSIVVDVSIFVPPTIEQAREYFLVNGYRKEIADKAFRYYNDANWFDRDGKKVSNWKRKFNIVWFKEENKIPPPPQQPKVHDDWKPDLSQFSQQ